MQKKPSPTLSALDVQRDAHLTRGICCCHACSVDVLMRVLPQVNLPSSGDFYSVSIQAANQKFFDQLMCIESSQNPNLGSQYSGEVGG